jgi:TolA-binding protein
MRPLVAALALLLTEGCVPPDATEHLRHAEGEHDRGHYGRARDLYRAWLERYPNDPAGAHVRYRLGRAYFETENYPAALREFTRVANEHPADPVRWEALLWGGAAQARLGRCPEALEYFSVVVGGTEGRTAPAELQRQAQAKMDELADDMQGSHRICTVRPRG